MGVIMHSFQNVKDIKPAIRPQINLAKTADRPPSPHLDTRPLVLIVDDVTVERECLAKAVEARSPEFQVVARASVAEQRIDLRPDVILVGMESVDLEGNKASEMIHSIQSTLPGVPIVLLTEDAQSASAGAELLDLGVCGCLSYSVGIEGLTKVLWLVLHGGACFPQESICQARRTEQAVADMPLFHHLQPAAFSEAKNEFSVAGLTGRECDVVRQLRLGNPNKIIAYELGISVSTVKVHIRNIMRKTGATNRVQAAMRPTPRANSPQSSHRSP